MENYIFVFLKLIVISICYIYGYVVSKCKHRHWGMLLIPILVQSLNEGLRFGRGVDYNGYFFKYHNCIKYGYEESKEFLFVFLCKVLGFCGIPYQGFIFLLSAILATCAFIYVYKRHSSVIMYALPMFVVLSLDAENLIRWFLAFSFILLALSFYEEGKFKKAILWCIIGCMFHNAIVLVVPFFVLLSYFKKPLCHPAVGIMLYLILYYLGDVSFMSNIAYYANMLSIQGQYSGYVENADAWLTGTANAEMTRFNIGIVISDLLVVFLGYCVTKYDKRSIYVYNLCIFGTIASSFFYQIEILGRIFCVFKIFQFLVIAYIILYFLKRNTKNSIYRILSVVLVLNIARIYVFNFLAADINDVLYIWDSNGRNVLTQDF